LGNPAPNSNVSSKGSENYRPYSPTGEEFDVENCEDQDYADIHYQPCPKPVLKEREIYTDD
jgi:hypothetical protein